MSIFKTNNVYYYLKKQEFLQICGFGSDGLRLGPAVEPRGFSVVPNPRGSTAGPSPNHPLLANNFIETIQHSALK